MIKAYSTPFFALLLYAFFLLPSPASAASVHRYVCADFNYFGSSNCVSDVITISGGGNIEDDVPNFNLGAGTWYITFNFAGSGPYRLAVNGQAYFLSGGSSSQSETAFTSAANGGLYIDNSGSATFDSVCIDDDGTSCTSAPPPAPIATSTYNCATLDASSTDCLVHVVDYPVLDIFLGYVLFFGAMAGTIWFTTLIL